MKRMKWILAIWILCFVVGFTAEAVRVQISNVPAIVSDLTVGNGVVIGHTAQLSTGGATAELQELGTSEADAQFAIGRWSANAGAGRITFYKSRHATIGSFDDVVSGDDLGSIRVYGDDGTDDDTESSRIQFDTEGTIGTGRVPGVITFSTAIDTAAGTLTEAMRITSAQLVGIGTNAPDAALEVSGTASVGIHIDAPQSATVSLDRASTSYDSSVLFKTGDVADWILETGNLGTNDILSFHRGGTDYLVLDEEGDVGIANTAPAEAFVIGAGTKTDGFATRNVAELQTDNAVQQTLDNVTLLDENTYHFEAYVVAVQSDGTDRASYHIAATVYRTGAGGATLQGGVTSLHTQESNGALDATFTVDTNDIRVSVTGIAAETWEFGCTMNYINMSN